MVYVSSAILFVAWNLCVDASPPSQAPKRRELSRPFIANIEPWTQVTDQNALDLDQEEMEQQLSLSNELGFEAAFRIYTEGANSKSVAEVTLEEPLTRGIDKGTYISGYTSNGNTVVAKALEDSPSGTVVLSVQYETFDDQNNYVKCRVGASLDPMLTGCLVANGTITIDEKTEIGYSYNPRVNNVNKRTIQGLSLSAKKDMWQCSNCPYDYYKAYVEYYGFFDYANQIVEHAFVGDATDFNNFDSDFGLYDFDGRAQVIKKTTAYMIFWMTVVSTMEVSIDNCNSKCSKSDCNEDSAFEWDVAVAYYTGTLEGDNGMGSGKLLYALADKRCQNFKTCGENADSVQGTSYINNEIKSQFIIGLNTLKTGDCDGTVAPKEAIKKLMLIPLVQGTLRYAWKTEYQAYSEKSEAEGAIFAMSIIPLVHRCDPGAAKIIETNLVVGQKRTAVFADVKKAFEDTYECMGIDPALVGGLYDAATNSYFVGAGPMGGVPVTTSSAASWSISLTAGLAAASIVGSALFFL
jgi:hypothetical protein